MNLSRDKSARRRRLLRPWILPIAMVVGAVFHDYMGFFEPLAPWLIFAMLTVTFCRLDIHAMRLDAMVWRLLAVQLAGAAAAYAACVGVSRTLAQGVFICVFCPTATAAPVITAMLGGSLERLVSFSVVSNVAVALLAPVAFALIGSGTMGFGESVATVAMRVAPLLLVPLLAALSLKRLWPTAHATLARSQALSFYIWAVSLIIVVGRAVSFVMEMAPGRWALMLWLAVASAVACVAQFAAGRMIGRRSGDTVAGTQGLGQKNTVLAIWMALTWLNPLSSVAPAAYVLWQNTLNSLQLWLRSDRDDGESNQTAPH